MGTEPLLDARRLRVAFASERGLIRAVDGIDLTIAIREKVGLVGESGCGKSVSSLAVMRLIPTPPGVVRADRIRFAGEDILTLPEPEMEKIRGNRMSMVFQEPMTSLNPVITVGEQIAEVYRKHRGMGKADAAAAAVDMLKLVNVSAPAQRAKEFPHQLSGGMRQRVMIAMALACRPQLLIADEPTTALDVTVQAQILDLMMALREEMGMALLLITHDLGVVAETVDRVIVMYAGRVVEEAPVRELFGSPLHPYTIGLLESLPRLSGERRPLQPIRGSVPHPSHLPAGCRFHPRCDEATERCAIEEPPLGGTAARQVRCWLRPAPGAAAAGSFSENGDAT